MEREREREQWMIHVATTSQDIEESRIATIAKLRKAKLLMLLRRTQNYRISFGTFFFLFGTMKLETILIQWIEQVMNLNY